MKPVLVGDLGPGIHTIVLPEVVIVSPDLFRQDHPDEEEMTVPPSRQLVQDEAGRVGEVMGPPQPGSRQVALRPVGGGPEWWVPADSVTPVDAADNPLQAPQEDA
jgi:hypothetical protein